MSNLSSEDREEALRRLRLTSTEVLLDILSLAPEFILDEVGDDVRAILAERDVDPEVEEDWDD